MDYEPELRRHLRRFLQPGDLMLDVGANIGLHTLFASTLVGPAGRIHAFEPDPQSSVVLLENLSANNVDNVTIWSCAVGSSHGFLDLFIDLRTARTSSVVAGHVAPYDKEDRRSMRVQVVRLDDLELGDGRVVFIKIDVEGAELQVLHGCRQLLFNHRPVVLLEVMETNLDRAVTELQALDYSVVDARSGQSIGVHTYSGNILATPDKASLASS